MKKVRSYAIIQRKEEVNMDTLIEFRNTNFGYDNTNAFTDFNMEIMEGDIITLIGTSGSGKTTLLKMLCNKLPNDSVYYKGKNIKTYNVKDLQQDIIVIFDLPITEETIKEELFKYTKHIEINEEEKNTRLEEMYKLFNLDEINEIEPKKLPKEKEYLIKILRYLILNPKFIGIDNIFNNLNAKDKKSIITYIKKKKITFLNVTTNIDEALYGNKLFVLENFVLILEGHTLTVLKTDTLLKRLGFKLPFTVDLSIELTHYEVFNKTITEKEKLVNTLWK